MRFVRIKNVDQKGVRALHRPRRQRVKMYTAVSEDGHRFSVQRVNAAAFPASSLMIFPVDRLEASDAKNATASAMSSGYTVRFKQAPLIHLFELIWRRLVLVGSLLRPP